MEESLKHPPYDPAVVAIHLADYEALYDELTTDVVRIQTQLADRNRTVDGIRLSDHDYHTWRKSASYAFNAKTMEKRILRRALHAARSLAEKVTPRTWVGGPEDLTLFCRTTANVLTEVLRRVALLESALPVGEDPADFADLAACVRENTEELRTYVTGLGDRVASATGMEAGAVPWEATA